MIDYIRGELSVKNIGFAVVETCGVGYAISIPLSTYETLPEPGSEVKLQIHYHVREDAHKLFGFSSDNERVLFRLLIGISKIGPKVALSILSGISVTDIVTCVSQGDPSPLKKIPGVGAKTAERLVMELKGKVGELHCDEIVTTVSSGEPAAPSVAASVKDELHAALLALGYNDRQVMKALGRVAETGATADEPIEVWVRKALQVI